MIDAEGVPKANDIIAARLGDEATIKTLTYDGNTIVLRAANPAERDIMIRPEDDFAVLGVVCGVFRPFVVNNEDARGNMMVQVPVPAGVLPS